MIAYDFDGVIIPEFSWIEGASSTDILDMSFNLQPIFQPKGNYAIITGRSGPAIEALHAWIEAKLAVKPLILFTNTEGMQPSNYKAMIINNNPQITKFIESEETQAKYIREHTSIEVVLINDLLVG